MDLTARESVDAAHSSTRLKHLGHSGHSVNLAYPESTTIYEICRSNCRRPSKPRNRAWKSLGVPPLRHAMIVRKTTPPKLSLSTPSPEASPHCSTIFSDCDADDEGTMSAEELTTSRPCSVIGEDSVLNPVGPYCPRRPTLRDVLNNTAPPPWSLSAFTAYLSQNHCLETLEFTMDAERYRQRFDKMAAQMAGMPMTPGTKECDYVRMRWQRVMEAYIVPNAPREVNLPSHVRDTLLSLPNHTSPPLPEELDAAVKIIYELMDESVLIPFLNDVSYSRGPSSYNTVCSNSDENLHMRESLEEPLHHSRSRRRVSPPTHSEPTVLSHISLFTHGSSKGRLSTHTSNISTGSGDGMLSDDSGSPSSPGKEPMTPPTTPPSSDIGGSSPRTKSDNAWKKMMDRLGAKKKSSSRMRRSMDEGPG